MSWKNVIVDTAQMKQGTFYTVEVDSNGTTVIKEVPKIVKFNMSSERWVELPLVTRSYKIYEEIPSSAEIEVYEDITSSVATYIHETNDIKKLVIRANKPLTGYVQFS